jgi:hypothetical protein
VPTGGLGNDGTYHLDNVFDERWTTQQVGLQQAESFRISQDSCLRMPCFRWDTIPAAGQESAHNDLKCWFAGV